jgi:hypothetical protein
MMELFPGDDFFEANPIILLSLFVYLSHNPLDCLCNHQRTAGYCRVPRKIENKMTARIVAVQTSRLGRMLYATLAAIVAVEVLVKLSQETAGALQPNKKLGHHIVQRSIPDTIAGIKYIAGIDLIAGIDSIAGFCFVTIGQYTQHAGLVEGHGANKGEEVQEIRPCMTERCIRVK